MTRRRVQGSDVCAIPRCRDGAFAVFPGVRRAVTWLARQPADSTAAHDLRRWLVRLAGDAVRAEAWLARWRVEANDAREVADELLADDGAPVFEGFDCPACNDGVWTEDKRDTARAALGIGDLTAALVALGGLADGAPEAPAAWALDPAARSWLLGQNEPILSRLATANLDALAGVVDPLRLWSDVDGWFSAAHGELAQATWDDADDIEASEAWAALPPQVRGELRARGASVGNPKHSHAYVRASSSSVDGETIERHRAAASRLAVAIRAAYVEVYADVILDLLCGRRPVLGGADVDQVALLLPPPARRAAIDRRIGAGEPLTWRLLATALPSVPDDHWTPTPSAAVRLAAVRWLLPHLARLEPSADEPDPLGAAIGALGRLGFSGLRAEDLRAMAVGASDLSRWLETSTGSP